MFTQDVLKPLVATGLLALGPCPMNPCRNTITATLASPSKVRTAVVFERGCGAMTSRAGTGVSILPGRDTTLSPPDKGNIYLNDNETRSPGAAGPGPRTDVQVEWKADTTLVIHQHSAVHVVFAAIKFSGITIEYDTLP
jgi:hypothetical protein